MLKEIYNDQVSETDSYWHYSFQRALYGSSLDPYFSLVDCHRLHGDLSDRGTDNKELRVF